MVAIGLDQRLVLARLLIEACELAVRAVVAAIDRDDLLECLGGPVELAEALFPRRGHALVQRHALGVRRRGVELRLEHVEVLLGLLGLLVELLEGAQRHQVRGIEVEHLLVRADRLPGVVEADVPDRADLEPEPDDFLLVGRQLRAPRHHVDQRLPLLGAAIQPLERDQRRRRRRIVDERLLVRVDRAADVLHLAFEQLGELDVEIRLLLGRRLDGRVRCSVSISSLQLPRLR